MTTVAAVKYEYCPECESPNLGTQRSDNCTHKQHCYDCEWDGENYIPEPKEVLTTKIISPNNFYGYQYTAYDKYGYEIIHSETFRTEEEALKSIEIIIEHGKSISDGPYTIILWPKEIQVQGKLFT